ncbi:MAG: hypothetical protein ACFCGT_25535 [Sandaracinaceae bacterium]
MARWRATLAVLGVALLTSAGCTVEVIFDPLGDDVSVSGSWRIEGQAASRANCQSLGVNQVRVAFFDRGDLFEVGSLVYPCEIGSFDTRPDRVLAAGTYEVALQAIDAAGLIIGSQDVPDTVTVDVGDHLALNGGAPFNIIGGADNRGTIEGSWTIDGLVPTAGLCAELGADAVDLVFFDTGGEVIPDQVERFDCVEGGIAVLIDPGTYTVALEAFDTATETVIASGPRETFTLAAQGTQQLNGGTPIAFSTAFDPLGDDGTLSVGWTVGDAVPTRFACDSAGVARVDVVFYAEDDAGLEEGVVVDSEACSNGFIPEGSPSLRAGTYQAVVEFHGSETGDDLLAATEALVAIVRIGQNTDLATIDYRLPETSVAFDLRWESQAVPNVFDDCLDAGSPDLIGWTLLDGGGGTVLESPDNEQACEDSLVFGLGSTPALGTYELLIEGFVPGALPADPPVKAWDVEGSCETSVGEAGDLGVATCTLRYTL